MKKRFLLSAAVLACLVFTACTSVEYTGESLPSLPSDAPVKFYLATELEKMPGVEVLGTAEYMARSSLTAKDIRDVLRKAARREGANGIRVVYMEKIPDGEARKDQINNTGAPQWNVSDNSDTSLAYMKRSINYSNLSDKEKTVYKTFVKAEFLSVPESEQYVETRP